MSRTDRGILLDTHVWIWLCNGSSELDTTIIQKINTAGKQGNVFVSAISIWEMGMLAAKNRIILTLPINQWVRESLAQPGMNLYPLSPEIALESFFLPGNFHGDPADRIITATARVGNLTLLTRDRQILEYSNSAMVKAIAV
jgi:PIN domain nuclease of toxin-antitoxin system